MFEDDKKTLKDDVILSDKEDTSMKSFGDQWLEARGKLKSGELHTGDNHFIAKHKSQSTYLTELGGALSVELDGSWSYLMNTQNLSLDESSLEIDRVKVESLDGLVHELIFKVQLKNSLVSIQSVEYINPYKNTPTPNASETEESIEAVDVAEIEELISLVESSVEQQESIEEETLFDIQQDKVPDEIVDDEVLENESLVEENTLKDEQEHMEKLLKVQELMNQRQEEAALSKQQEEKDKTLEDEKTLKDEQVHMEKLLKVQELMNQRREEASLSREQENDDTLDESVNEKVDEDTRTLEDETALVVEQVETEELLGNQTLMQKKKEESVLKSEEETTEVPEEEVEKVFEEGIETEMLLGSQALMQKKQEESALIAEEDTVEEDEEIKSKPAYAGDDEMLLKVQSLMNAKKTIDTSEIEFTGGDAPFKEEEKEADTEEEPESVQEEEIDKEEIYDESSLKGKIVLAEVDGSEVFTSSFYLEGFLLNPDGSFVYEPHDISHAYLTENEIESYDFEVEVKRANSLNLIGRIELIVTGSKNGVDLSFRQGEFSKLEETQTSEYTELSVDELSQTDDEFLEHHTEDTPEDTHGHLAVVFDSLEEGASLHSDGTLGITVMLPTGAQNGETIIINSSEFIITDAEAEAGQLLYSVYPDDEVEVSFRDSDNNTSDSIRAKANQKNIEIIEFLVAAKLTGEVGAQSVHASIGVPPNPEVVWGIMEQGKQISNYVQSEFGSVHVDGETGEIEYKYQEQSGLNKYGSSADNNLNENFIIYLGLKPYADLEVSLHIQAQSIHGYSGHEIDSSTIEEMKLLKIDTSKLKVEPQDNTEMIEMLESGLENNKAKISKLMLEIYEAKSTGADVSVAKEKLHTLTDKKIHLVNKLNDLRKK